MATLRKWDEWERAYYPYDIPDDWEVTAFAIDMDKVVNCARCGRKVVFGDTYTSCQIHTSHGFGYAVCESCHDREWRERRAAEKEGF